MNNPASRLNFPFLSICMIALLLITIPACGKKDVSQTGANSSFGGSRADFIRREAEAAIDMIEMNLGGMQDGGGYQAWTAEKAAAELIPLLNVLQEPEPGAPRSFRTKFTYVADEVTDSFQVVIRVEDENLQVAAYGKNTETPLATRTIPVSQY